MSNSLQFCTGHCWINSRYKASCLLVMPAYFIQFRLKAISPSPTESMRYASKNFHAIVIWATWCHRPIKTKQSEIVEPKCTLTIPLYLVFIDLWHHVTMLQLHGSFSCVVNMASPVQAKSLEKIKSHFTVIWSMRLTSSASFYSHDNKFNADPKNDLPIIR